MEKSLKIWIFKLRKYIRMESSAEDILQQNILLMFLYESAPESCKQPSVTQCGLKTMVISKPRQCSAVILGSNAGVK